MSTPRCVYCGATNVPLHRDHIIPHSRGGGDDARNSFTACSPCNLGKADRTPREWKPQGLPDWIYKLEDALVERYAMTSRKRRGQLGPITAINCHYCSAVIVATTAGTIDVFDQEVGPPFLSPQYCTHNAAGDTILRPAMSYPGTGKYAVECGAWHRTATRALFAHYNCGSSSIPYWISLDRLDEDWESHLRGKVWWDACIASALYIARSVFNISVKAKK